MEIPRSVLSTLKAGFVSSARARLETALLAGRPHRRPLQEEQTPRPLQLARAIHPWPRPARQPIGTPMVPMAQRCLNPGNVSAQAACGARSCGRHRIQLQSRTPRLTFCGSGFIAPLRGWPRRLSDPRGRLAVAPPQMAHISAPVCQQQNSLVISHRRIPQAWLLVNDLTPDVARSFSGNLL